MEKEAGGDKPTLYRRSQKGEDDILILAPSVVIDMACHEKKDHD